MAAPLPSTAPVRLPDHAFTSPSAIIDVEQSFRQTIEQYTLLERAASSLLTDMTTLSPQQILVRSNHLARMQQALADHDDQLIAILSLAGAEIVNTPFVMAYREILAQVTLTFDQIWEQTSLVKKKLLKGSTIHGNIASLFHN